MVPRLTFLFFIHVFVSDFENEDFVYAVVCGVFLSSNDQRKEVMDKMKEIVPYANCTFVNLTESHNLERACGKDSYAFCLEYDYSSDTAKGKMFFPKITMVCI